MSNSIEITGNIGGDVELKYGQSGAAFLRLSIADTPRKKDPQTGEWEDAGETMWVSATVFGPDAEHYAGLIHKGSRVTAYGTLSVRSYTAKDGTQRQGIDLRVDALKVHEDRRQPQPSRQQPAQTYGQPQGNGYGQPQQANPWGQQGAEASVPF